MPRSARMVRLRISEVFRAHPAEVVTVADVGRYGNDP